VSTVHETCPCGATFDFHATGRGADLEARIAVSSWRKDHRHDPPQPEQPEQPEQVEQADAVDEPAEEPTEEKVSD